MSDDLDLVKAATHAATGIGGGGLVGVLMRMLQSREAQAMRDEFIAMRGDVKRLIDDVNEHKKVFEDVVETKLSLRALHKRFDDIESRVERIESKRK